MTPDVRTMVVDVTMFSQDVFIAIVTTDFMEKSAIPLDEQP